MFRHKFYDANGLIDCLCSLQFVCVEIIVRAEGKGSFEYHCRGIRHDTQDSGSTVDHVLQTFNSNSSNDRHHGLALQCLLALRQCLCGILRLYCQKHNVSAAAYFLIILCQVYAPSLGLFHHGRVNVIDIDAFL